ncbi:MAG TPA: hypothetical protein VGO47_12985 [Chlamydiales bacterium]|nr:hypothetical protein [Chlamydiales bacterium]
MTSDETDAEEDDGSHVLSIRMKRWRNKVLTMWLHDLDILCLALRVTTSGTVKRGNWPHRRRTVPGKFSEGGPVESLPKSFYDTAFLETLSAEHRENLQVIHRLYNLTHTAQIQ